MSFGNCIHQRKMLLSTLSTIETEEAMSKTATARIDDELSEQLDSLSEAMNRPKAYIVEQAIRRYVHDEAWQIEKIKSALNEYEQGRAQTVPFEEVMDRLDGKIRAKLG